MRISAILKPLLVSIQVISPAERSQVETETGADTAGILSVLSLRSGLQPKGFSTTRYRLLLSAVVA